ncbi:hypothetical protein V5799_030537 [Amblyomma americanum]|uniref:Uncharacterized protein n=1 Tax=Amblyomma americanum TaxID=6943 RepID=A0AAQ4EN00_AMBAM
MILLKTFWHVANFMVHYGPGRVLASRQPPLRATRSYPEGALKAIAFLYARRVFAQKTTTTASARALLVAVGGQTYKEYRNANRIIRPSS